VRFRIYACALKLLQCLMYIGWPGSCDPGSRSEQKTIPWEQTGGIYAYNLQAQGGHRRRRVGTAHHSGTILHWWAMSTIQILFTAVVVGFMIIGCTPGCPRITFYQLAENQRAPRVLALSLSPCEGKEVDIIGKASCLADWTAYMYVELKIINRMDDTLLFDFGNAYIITASHDSISFDDAFINDQLASTPVRLRPGKKERVGLRADVEYHNPHIGLGYPYEVHLGQLNQSDDSMLCSLPPVFMERPLYGTKNESTK